MNLYLAPSCSPLSSDSASHLRHATPPRRPQEAVSSVPSVRLSSLLPHADLWSHGTPCSGVASPAPAHSAARWGTGQPQRLASTVATQSRVLLCGEGCLARGSGVAPPREVMDPIKHPLVVMRTLSGAARNSFDDLSPSQVRGQELGNLEGDCTKLLKCPHTRISSTRVRGDRSGRHTSLT